MPDRTPKYQFWTSEIKQHYVADALEHRGVVTMAYDPTRSLLGAESPTSTLMTRQAHNRVRPTATKTGTRASATVERVGYVFCCDKERASHHGRRPRPLAGRPKAL